MDVRCESCNSEYEFDGARIPSAGLPVKCSTCGHVFRVYPPHGDLPPSTSSGEWMVRQANGSVFTFRELTTLQRWIVERKVARGDEISKTGKQWKRLGDIAELATFFQVVEAQPQQPLGHLVPGTGPQAQMPVPPGTGPQAQMPLPPGTGPQAQMPVRAGTGPQAQMPVPAGTGPQAAWEGQEQQLGFNPPSGNWQMHESDPGFADSTFDDDDFDLEIRRGGAGKWVVLLLLVIIGGGAAGLYAFRPDLVDRLVRGGAVDPAVAEQVAAGYRQLARDSYAAHDQAIATFEEAMRTAPDYADARAGLAEAEVGRAEYLREEADELAAGLEATPVQERAAVEVEIENKRREASRRAERAFEVAREALVEMPDNVAANRAMADYFRLMSAIDKMQPRVEAARKRAPGDARLEVVIGASLAEEAPEAAVNHLESALAASPELQRARYRLASVHLAAGENDKAAVHLERLLQEVPDHERGRALEQRLAPPEPAPEPESEPEPEKPKVTFDGLMNEGDRLRDRDRPGLALKVYERAADLAPEEPDVHLGIGWCYIDLEQPAAAISTFKTALRYAPRLSDAHMGLAEGYRMKGDNQNAIEHYEKYLDIIPNGPESGGARRMIKLLKK